MDLSAIGLAKILLPHTPLLLKTAFLNTLSLSPNASKQDLRTELTVSVIRELIKKPNAIGKAQLGSLKDPGIKGKMWISKVTLPKPEDTEGLTPRDAIEMVIKELGDGSETYTLPEMAAVGAEWTGYRGGVDANAPRPDLPEEEHYKRLMSEIKSDVTILYFHGGAYFLMDPASHRRPVSHLARLTQGRCLSVRYRLSPLHPFPAPLLDALVAYLSLISPPPGSLHAAIRPQNIVFAGDSAGGNLSLSLLLSLLSLQRLNIKTIRFHGIDVPLSLPAALALNSPWCDLSRSLPSCHTNARLDYVAPPAGFGFADDLPTDEIWPAAPPRVDLYVNARALLHPLVLPVVVPAEGWRGSPPVYMCLGSEALEDEIALTARRMEEGGVEVVFDGYEGMPHCFGLIFPAHPMGRECMRSWGRFIGDVVQRNGVGEGQVQAKAKAKATWAKAFSDPVRKVEVGFGELKAELGDVEVESLLREKRDRYVEKEERLMREWRETQGIEQEQGQVKSRL